MLHCLPGWGEIVFDLVPLCWIGNKHVGGGELRAMLESWANNAYFNMLTNGTTYARDHRDGPNLKLNSEAVYPRFEEGGRRDAFVRCLSRL